MKITLPNPLGAPISLSLALDSLPSLPLRGSSNQRRTQLRVVLLTFIVACTLLFHPSPPFPPSYAAERRLEKFLPQHDRSLPFPEGRGGRYVR